MRRMYSKPQLLEAVEEESNLNGIKVFEDIKDKDGHARFIEGDVDRETDVTNITKKYGKWALSGSHLLIVFAFSVENDATINSIIARLQIPEWIHNKLVPIQAQYVSKSSFELIGSDISTQDMTCFLTKAANNNLVLDINSVTLTAHRECRVVFSLLIDNN